MKVTETVCLPIDGLHLVMEAFCNSMIAREPPHGGNLPGPGMERPAQRDQLREDGLFQLR